jgi:tetratricopeptide (TPR) repeat protein
MAELLLLLLVLAAAGLLVAWPLLDRVPPRATVAASTDRETLLARHRLALEALRDVEADHRAGSLDEPAYAVQRAEAEARAAETLAALDTAPQAVPAARPGRRTRSTATMLGIGMGALLLLGFVLPQPFGVGERTVTDQALANALAAEDARQATISTLRDRIAADPSDTQALSDLADAFLAGSSAEDQQRGAAALIVLLSVEPHNSSAYRRLITAYMNAGDWTDARSAVEAYAGIADPNEPDIPFFRGLLALRADNDPAEAVRQFDEFLQLAPEDGRVPMVTSLREQALGQENGT